MMGRQELVDVINGEFTTVAADGREAVVKFKDVFITPGTKEILRLILEGSSLLPHLDPIHLLEIACIRHAEWDDSQIREDYASAICLPSFERTEILPCVAALCDWMKNTAARQLQYDVGRHLLRTLEVSRIRSDPVPSELQDICDFCTQSPKTLAYVYAVTVHYNNTISNDVRCFMFILLCQSLMLTIKRQWNTVDELELVDINKCPPTAHIYTPCSDLENLYNRCVCYAARKRKTHVFVQGNRTHSTFKKHYEKMIIDLDFDPLGHEGNAKCLRRRRRFVQHVLLRMMLDRENQSVGLVGVVPIPKGE